MKKQGEYIPKWWETPYWLVYQLIRIFIKGDKELAEEEYKTYPWHLKFSLSLATFAEILILVWLILGVLK